MRELIIVPGGTLRERLPDDGRSKALLIYDLEGELFFGAAPELDRHLETLTAELMHTGCRYLVLRLRRTRDPDVVATERIERFLRGSEKHGVTVLLAGVRPDLAVILRDLRFADWLPLDRIYQEEGKLFSATLRAIRHARQLIKQDGGEMDGGVAEEEVTHDLAL